MRNSGLRSYGRSIDPRRLCPCHKESKDVWADFGRKCFVSLSPELRDRLRKSRGMKGAIKNAETHAAVFGECLTALGLAHAHARDRNRNETILTSVSLRKKLREGIKP